MGLDVGGMATLSRSSSAWVVPVKFWNPGMRPAGMPVSRMASRSARSAVSAGQVGEDAGIQDRQQPRQLGLGHEAGELASRSGPTLFQRSFWTIGTMTSLNSGLPRRDTWFQGPTLRDP